MVEFTMVIAGKPFTKQRPRFSRRNGRAFTPKATVNFEAVVQEFAAQIFPRPLEGPIAVDVEAIFEPPPSWSKKKRAAHMGQWHTQRPDRDNIEKAILDGLNRIAFVDDSQVAAGSSLKRWGEKAETRVTIRLLDPVPEGKK